MTQAALRHPAPASVFLCVVAGLVFSALVFARLSQPLLWNDESDTALFAQRVLDFGYPKVHASPSILYNLEPDRVHERTDAYLGGLWGYYYFGALGAALAARADDPYERTWRMRLPFALAGWLGVLLVPLALAPAFGDARGRARFGFLFLAGACYSVSLILHLREARWYPLALLLVSLLLLLYIRHQIAASLSDRVYWAGSSVLWFALFNTFYPGFAALALAIGLHIAARTLLQAGSPAERARAAARAGLPLAVAATAALPVALLFDLPGLAAAWAGFLEGVGRSYAENLRFAVSNLLRFEFLAPALAARAAVALLSAVGPAEPAPPAVRRRLQIASLLALLVTVYVLLLCSSPLLWERYFVPITPWLTALLLLDAFTLVDLTRRLGRSPLWGALGAAALGCVVASSAWLLWLRVPELRGRLQEIRAPVIGPLDAVIPYLRERYADPSRLVVATNYEGPAFTWYLGCRVAVGYYGGNLAEDRALRPDVIVSRPRQRMRAVLIEMAGRGAYTATGFPIANTPSNQVPSLWVGGPGRMRHAFVTQRARSAGEGVVILERDEDAEEPSAGRPAT